MKNRVHFFSIEDMSIPYYIQTAEKVIGEYEDGRKPIDANDYLELYHISLFIENKVYPTSWTNERLSLIEKYNKESAIYFLSLTTKSWPIAYSLLEFGYKETFFEALNRYSSFNCLDEDSIRKVISSNPYELRYILQIKRIVKKLDRTLSILLKENKKTAEWLLEQFVEKESVNQRKEIFFPKSLTLPEREQIILDYIDREDASLNYIRLILVAKNIKDKFVLSDKTRFAARKREQKLCEQLFASEQSIVIPMQHKIHMSGEDNVPIKGIEIGKDGYPILSYNSKYILSLNDVDILHYFRVVFEMISPSGCINLVSKESESSIMERIIGIKGKDTYETNIYFVNKEHISLIQTLAISVILEEGGRSIEKAIVNFYTKYLKDEFGYPALSMEMSPDNKNWIEKIRNLLPEFESVAHQYLLYAENNDIDEELLIIASPINYTDVGSCINKKYYTIDETHKELQYLFYIFFSDQSMLTYINPHKEKHYSCFFDMLIREKIIPYANYQNYQLDKINHIISQGYIKVNNDGNIEPTKISEILLLKLLYEYHVCSYWAFDENLRTILDDMINKGWLIEDNHLLSKKEREYFSYYLNNEKFTNGPALRNKYNHGAIGSSVDDESHKKAYYRLLNLFILFLLKIEDDLMLRDLQKNQQINIME